MIPAAITGMVFREVLKAIQRPSVPVSDANAVDVANAVTREIEPIIAHQTNNEPWYQSRVTIGALVSVGTGFATLAGFAFQPEDITLVTNMALGAGALGGGLFTLYGRWRAKKPLGQ